MLFPLLKEAVAAKNANLANRMFPTDSNQAYHPKRSSNTTAAEPQQDLADLSVEAFNRKRRSAGLAPVRINHGRSALDVACDLTSAAAAAPPAKRSKATVNVESDDDIPDLLDPDFALACRLSAEQERLEQLNQAAYATLLGSSKGKALLYSSSLCGCDTQCTFL